MANKTSYYLYQKYEQRDGQQPIPCYPIVKSVDGEGTMPKVIRRQDDPQCGYVPDPTYRWYQLPISEGYVCDDCESEPMYRWQQMPISQGYVCDDCPTPPVNKLVANYSDGKVLNVECNDSTTLTREETQPSGYVASAMTNVVIGDCVTSIGDGAFYNCTSLTSIAIPNSVTDIGHNVFNYCSSLTSIVIPDSVTSIGYRAFRYCASLTSITCLASVVPRLGLTAFANTNNCPIYVPASSVEAYKSDTNWSYYASRIQPIQ